MKTLAITLFFLSFFFCIQDSYSQGVYQDVIKLKNGSIIKGMVTEVEDPNSIGIKTSDGNFFVFSKEDVESISKEEVQLVPITSTNQMYIRSKEKEPGLAFLFSFLLPGGGQYYNGEYLKGGILTGASIAGLAVAVAGVDDYDYYHGYSNNNNGMIAAGFIISFAAHLWSMVDAPASAKRINKTNEIRFRQGMTLKINPDYSLNKEFIAGKSKYNPSIGMKMSLNF